MQHTSNEISVALSSSASQPAVSVTAAESATSGMGSLSHREKRRHAQRRSNPRTGSGMEQGEFSRQDKVVRLEAAIIKIQDNNTFLAEQAK